MKGFGLWFMLMAVVGTALVFLTFTVDGFLTGHPRGEHLFSAIEILVDGSHYQGLRIFRSVFPAYVESTRTTTNKILKENSYHYPIGTKKKRDLSNINLEDYHTIDPPPILTPKQGGPIEHCAPVMPHIPPPTPPSHPRNGGSP